MDIFLPVSLEGKYVLIKNSPVDTMYIPHTVSIKYTVNGLYLAVYSIQRVWQNAAYAKSSDSLNAMYISIRIVTFIYLAVYSI